MSTFTSLPVHQNFPECVARVPQPFATVRNRLQPSATLRNRPRHPRMAVPMVSSANGVTFGGFTCGIASFCVAGVALRDIQTCLATCRKSFCVARAILLRRFQKMCCSFRGRRSTLRAFLRVALSGLRQVATRCKFRGRRGILWDVMKTDGGLARNIDFQVANFQVLRKTRGKASILKLQSVKIGGRLARKAGFDAPTCLVSGLWFSCGLAVSMGEAAKPLLFEGFQAGCHVVLRGRSGAVWHSNLFDNASKAVLCSRRNTFVSFSQDPSCSCRDRRSILEISIVILRGRPSILDVSCCVSLHTFHSTLHTPNSTPHTLHSTLYTPHSTLHTLHSTLYTPHSTLHTLHSTLYTPHFTLHTAHSTLRTPHSTLYTPHFTLYTLQSILHTARSALHTLHVTLHTEHFALYTPHFKLHTLHCTLHTPYSTLYTLHFTLYTLHSPHYTLHSTLYTPHSRLHAFYTLHSTLYTPHSTLYTPHFTLHTPHFTFHTPHSTLYTLHFTLHTLRFTLFTLHSTLYTLHLALHTLHSTLHTFHSTLHTLHFTLLTPHSTLYTPHSALYTLHSAPYIPHFTLYTLHFTLHTLHFTLRTLHSTLYSLHATHYTPHSSLHTPHSTLHSTLYTLHSTLYTPHSTLHTPHFILCIPHFTLYTLHFTLHTLRSTLHTLHFAFHTLHSRLYTPHSILCTPPFSIFHSLRCTGLVTGKKNKTVEINCFTKVFYVTAYPCVPTSVPSTYVWAFGFVGCILFHMGPPIQDPSSWNSFPSYFLNPNNCECISPLKFPNASSGMIFSHLDV